MRRRLPSRLAFKSGVSASSLRRVASSLLKAGAEAVEGRKRSGARVEHKLAKVGVEGSNPFARSSNFNHLEDLVESRFWLGVTPG